MFEPMSEAFADNPYHFYARLRELDDPYFYEDINVYLLSKYLDVDGAARNPKLVRSQDLFLDQDDVKAQQRARNWHDMPNHERFVQSNLLERDGDSHFRLRVITLRAEDYVHTTALRVMFESVYVLSIIHILRCRRRG